MQLATFKKWSLSFENLINKLKERNAQSTKPPHNMSQQFLSPSVAHPPNNQTNRSSIAFNMAKSHYDPSSDSVQQRSNIK
jgi:hypothetical protein